MTGGNDSPPPDSTSVASSEGDGITTADATTEPDSTSRGGGYVTGGN